MTTFVLVHGSAAGGWYWKFVISYLRAAGHEVYAPTLTGLGERVHLLTPDVSLSTHIQDIVNVLVYEDLRDVVLVGASYGGMVITGVAEHAAERLQRLVYVDAFIPDDGESAFSIVPEVQEQWLKQAVEVDGIRARAPYTRDQMVTAWGITDPALVRWASERWTPMPLTTHEEPIKLPANRAAQLSRSSIYCTEGGTATLPFAQKARALGLDYHELPTGHVAPLSAPLPLAEMLQRIAASSIAI